MAIGGSHNKGMMNNNGSRGRSYGLMVLLAFGAALFGVMLLHKLRERRIFTLLVKEKDHQLFSLHFLLQVLSLTLSCMHASLTFHSVYMTSIKYHALFSTFVFNLLKLLI